MSDPIHLQQAVVRSVRIRVDRTSDYIMTRTEAVTHLELDGSIPIDPTRPVYITQEEP